MTKEVAVSLFTTEKIECYMREEKINSATLNQIKDGYLSSKHGYTNCEYIVDAAL